MVISWFYIYIKASCGSTFSLREEQSRMILLSMALIGSYLNQPSCLSPFTHIREKKQNKEWAFKICSCFSFSDVCGIGSAQISSFWPVNQTHRQQRPSRAADWKEETVKEKKHQCAAEVSAVIADLGWTEREKNTLTFRVVLTQMGEYSYSAQTPTHTPHTHTHTHLHTPLSFLQAAKVTLPFFA